MCSPWPLGSFISVYALFLGFPCSVTVAAVLAVKDEMRRFSIRWFSCFVMTGKEDQLPSVWSMHCCQVVSSREILLHIQDEH